MLGYSRVLIEPSGIFDVDEFFDILHESPLDSMYNIENVITIVNSELNNDLSHEANYLLASQAANAGCIVFSHIDNPDAEKQSFLLSRINDALKTIKCDRIFNDGNTFAVNWKDFTLSDFEKLSHSGYSTQSFEKNFSIEQNGFESLFFMHIHMDINTLKSKIRELFHDESAGTIVRVKGFIMSDTDNGWIEINATEKAINTNQIKNGQEVLIVIGEHLNREKIDSYFQSKYSSCRRE